MRPHSNRIVSEQTETTHPRLNRDRIRETLHEIINPEVDENALLRDGLNSVFDLFKQYFSEIGESFKEARAQFVTEFYRDVANMRASLYREYKSDIHLSTRDKDFQPFKLGWAKEKRITKVLHRNPALERVWNSIKGLAYSWDHEITSRVAAKEGFTKNVGRGRVVNFPYIIFLANSANLDACASQASISRGLVHMLLYKNCSMGIYQRLFRIGHAWAYAIGIWDDVYLKKEDKIIPHVPRYFLKGSKEIKRQLREFQWGNAKVKVLPLQLS